MKKSSETGKKWAFGQFQFNPLLFFSLDRWACRRPFTLLNAIQTRLGAKKVRLTFLEDKFFPSKPTKRRRRRAPHQQETVESLIPRLLFFSLFFFAPPLIIISRTRHHQDTNRDTNSPDGHHHHYDDQQQDSLFRFFFIIFRPSNQIPIDTLDLLRGYLDYRHSSSFSCIDSHTTFSVTFSPSSRDRVSNTLPSLLSLV